MSADSLEIRVIKLESDVKRIEQVGEPRFERIEAQLEKLDDRLDKLADMAEAHERRLISIETTLRSVASKEDLQRVVADVHKAISDQGARYTGWLLGVGGWMFLLTSMAVAAVKYLVVRQP